MNDKRAFSYHTFILPFIWKNPGNRRLDFDAFGRIFDNNPFWIKTEPKDEASFDPEKDIRLFYNEHQYFYPQVRSALYGYNGNVVKNYVFAPDAVHEKAHYYISKGGRTYDLLLNQIRFKIYSTGVALFILECENYGKDKNGNGQTSFADIKNINDFGRRINLPFIPEKPDDFSACADSLELFIPEFNSSFTTDFYGFISKVSEQNEKGKQEILSLNYLCAYIKKILSYGSDCEFTSDKDNKDAILIRPALDDRMFVACIFDSPEETKKLLEIKNGEYSYLSDAENSKSLYEYVFLDPPKNCSCQSSDMRKRLLETHIYDRWNDLGTVYGIAAQSLVMLSENPPSHLTDAFLTEYVQMVCLCIAQKASLMVFQKETADLSTQIHGNGKKIKIKTTTALMDLQERFAAFKSQLCFDEVTVQEQGIEIYDLIKSFFLIDRELENVRDQIDGLHDATDTYLDFNFNKIGYIFTFIGALYGIMQILPEAMAYFTEKHLGLTGDTEWLAHLFWFIGAIVLGLGCYAVIAFIYRRKRK